VSEIKISLCHHYSITFYAGGEKMILKLAKNLSDIGHDVEIRSIPLYRKNIDLRKDLQGIPYSESWVHFFDTDVAYIVYAPMVSNFFITRAPRIAGIHGFIPASSLSSEEATNLTPIQFYKRYGLMFTLANSYFKHFQKFDFSGFDAIHIINQSMKFEHNYVYYVPNYIDTSFYTTCKEKNEKFTVLFTGRHEWSKGWEEYRKTCWLLSELGYNFRFLCTGEGDKIIEGLGFVEEEDLPKLYSEAHVTLYPAKIDTFGLVIIESLACGTPVVTTPILAHRGLGLPLHYADCPIDFAKNIIEIYYQWKYKNGEYMKEKEKFQAMVKKYDKINVFPKFVNMIENIYR
jgi:glycosyltransferase involved in cell wall biosynthesis